MWIPLRLFPSRLFMFERERRSSETLDGRHEGESRIRRRKDHSRILRNDRDNEILR